MVAFNVSKTKQGTLHHRRLDSELLPVTMNGCPLKEETMPIENIGAQTHS